MARKRSLQEMVIDAVSGLRKPAVPGDPELNSSHCGWRSIHVEQHQVEPMEVAPAAPVNHVFAVHMNDMPGWEVSDGEGLRLHPVRAGQVSFFPAGEVFSARTRERSRFLMVSLAPGMVLNHAASDRSGALPRFVARRGIEDPVARVLCERIRAEAVLDGARDAGYVEALGKALAAHALRDYTEGTVAEDVPGGLEAHQLQRAIDFFRDHLLETASVGKVASVVGLTRFHFGRCFKRSTGLSPHQYLLRMRVDRARYLLETTSDTVNEVAIKSGFCDPSHLSTYFRRWVGVSPRQHRNRFRS